MLALLLAIPLAPQELAARPNILWITSEDHGPQLGCYGDPDAVTPNLDALAAQGMRFERVWSNAPVCAPARTALITGVWPPSLGAQDMRTLVQPPEWLRFFPQLLRQAGYYCANNRKEDYNLVQPGRVWDESSAEAHWRLRGEGQPFFAVFNFTLTHESQVRKRPHEQVHDPAKVRVPGFHPDLPEVRRDWAQYHDQISELDARVGRLLAELEDDGLAEDTIVFFFSDHGPGLSRCKRWPYDSGLRVPLIVRIPPKWRGLAAPDWTPGGLSHQLLEFLDFAPTVLSLAGIEPPAWMHGDAFLGEHTRPTGDFLHGFRGRMDERFDLVRSVTDGRYVYIRNYLPHLPQGQFVDYESQTPTFRAWRAAYDAGGLPLHLARFWEPKPREELYDLQTDPDEIRNLASSPAHEAARGRLRAELERWLLRTRDLGLMPEAQMHALAGGAPPAALGADASRYPLEEILRRLGRSSGFLHRNLFATAAGEEDDPVLGWWGVISLLHEHEASLRNLSALAAHADPSIRVLALEALALRGTDEDRAATIPALIALCHPSAEGPWLALAAWNALDHLDALAAPYRGAIESIPIESPLFPARLAPNFPKLRAKTLADLSAAAAPAGG
ncbi:MAG: sulfatase [Planctomycetes bacterium]|nr:sulfatase [Planctomycetota bacterium]